MQVNIKPTNLITHKIILWLLTGSILITGSYITHKLWSNAHQDNLAKLHSALDDSANVTVSNLRARFGAILVIMHGVKGFIDGSDVVTPEEFHTYIKSLNLGDKFGVRGIALVELINDHDQRSHISHISKKNLSDLQIRPTGKRPLYAPITLIEPLDKLLGRKRPSFRTNPTVGYFLHLCSFLQAGFEHIL